MRKNEDAIRELQAQKTHEQVGNPHWKDYKIPIETNTSEIHQLQNPTNILPETRIIIWRLRVEGLTIPGLLLLMHHFINYDI